MCFGVCMGVGGGGRGVKGSARECYGNIDKNVTGGGDVLKIGQISVT